MSKRTSASAAKSEAPTRRRDGWAVALIALAIVVAIREWFNLSGAAGAILHHASAGLVGLLAVLLPVLLVIIAVRLIAHPENVAANGRVAIALAILISCIAGLIHIFKGRPNLLENFAGVESAGGIVGSYLGPKVLRRLPERPMRLVIGLLGLGLAVQLFADSL